VLNGVDTFSEIDPRETLRVAVNSVDCLGFEGTIAHDYYCLEFGLYPESRTNYARAAHDDE